MEKKECVVTFKNRERTVAMYFTEENEDLQMQMEISPEFKEGDAPDLPMMLSNVLLTALRDDNIEDNEPKVYDGQN